MASLESLEELEIGDETISAAALDTLRAVKRLKALHLVRPVWPRKLPADVALDGGAQLRVRADEAKEFCRALDVLRMAKPGIVIDGDDGGHRGFLHAWADTRMIPQIPKQYAKIPDFLANITVYYLRQWDEGKRIPGFGQ